ncbi:MAG: hypothetical protein P4L65_09335 [Legionella sp.]|nr:hypothetical protein [Legionella sp.]
MIAFYAKAIAVNTATAVLITLTAEKAIEQYNKITRTSIQNMFFKRIDLCTHSPSKLNKASPKEPDESTHPSM